VSETAPVNAIKINPFLVAYNNPDAGLVVMLDNNEFETPGIWGLVLADVLQHLVNAYIKDGMSPRETREEILSMFLAEVQRPTSQAESADAEWSDGGFTINNNGEEE
jgi:hypothetical protein